MICLAYVFENISPTMKNVIGVNNKISFHKDGVGRYMEVKEILNSNSIPQVVRITIAITETLMKPIIIFI